MILIFSGCATITCRALHKAKFESESDEVGSEEAFESSMVFMSERAELLLKRMFIAGLYQPDLFLPRHSACI